MFKKVDIFVILLLSIFLSGIIESLGVQTTSASTTSDKQPDQLTSELERLKITQKRLIDYLDHLKPELHLLKEIDTTFIRTADMTHNGEPDTVFIHITGKSILDPFLVKYKVISDGKTIYYMEDEMPTVDHLFGNDNEEIPRLSAYLKEKSSYYFKYISERIIEKTVLSKSNGTFERKALNSIYYLFPEQLKKLGITDENKIKAIVDEAVERLQSGTYVLSVPTSPETIKFPRIFVPEVNSFLIIYKW